MAMIFPRARALAIGLAGAATLALGGCYDDGYGYGGVEVGAGYYGGGYGYGYDPYYAGGYGYGYPGYGWFDGFYYPGNGYYVYDRGGRRFRMRDSDRQHWYGRGDGQGPRGPRGEAGGWQRPGRPGTPPPGAGAEASQGRPDGGARPGFRDGRGTGNVQGQGQSQGYVDRYGGQRTQRSVTMPQSRSGFVSGMRSGNAAPRGRSRSH